eukprot:2705462-Amphidinium_carterae.3
MQRTKACSSDARTARTCACIPPREVTRARILGAHNILMTVAPVKILKASLLLVTIAAFFQILWSSCAISSTEAVVEGIGHWEDDFLGLWARYWSQEEALSICTRKKGLRCLLAREKYKAEPDAPRPLYQKGPDGKLHPTQPEDEMRLEPYVCMVQDLVVDYAVLAEDAQRFDYRGYGMSRSEYTAGALGIEGCEAPEEDLRWHSDVQSRCQPALLLARPSPVFAAMQIHTATMSQCVQDERLTVLAIRPAIKNYWEAHFAIVEAVMRLAAIGMLPQEGERGQVIFLPPDPSNDPSNNNGSGSPS